MPDPNTDGKHRGLRLLGFPTAVRPGFPLFLVLIGLLYPWPLGAWVAVSIGVFTVVHELGHALVARWFGCDARISLDFMVAYATFSPAPGFSRAKRALVAVAGAAFQVTAAVVVLLSMGVNPLSRSDIASGDASAAIWWTGIVLGLVNLIPITPLDGGAIVSSALDALFPRRGAKLMLRASIVITSIVLSVMIATGHSDFLPFFAFMLYLQWRTLRNERVIQMAVTRALEAPTGEPFIDSSAASLRLQNGDPAGALSYAVGSWMMCPSSDVAVVAARANAMLGNTDAALEWVEAAPRGSVDLLVTHAELNAAVELDGLRQHPRYVATIGRLAI
ncbi:MAG: hypothetical protein RLZZ526_1381 [Actinomycetota bacterium]